MKHTLLKYCLIALLLPACSKKNDNGGGTTPASTPSAGIEDVTQNRATASSTFRFYVNLSAAASAKATIDYSTTAGTAVAGKDFTAVSGTLTIDAGQSSGYIDVPVAGDSLRRDDQQFYVQLTNAKNCTLGTAKGTGTIVNANGLYLPTDNTGYTTPASYSGYHLAWSDEFNTTVFNTSNWNVENGGGGWGNNELEYYTGRIQNLFQSNGNLIIEARKENYGSNSYTSARINTAGKQQFTYGRIDMRAKLPTARGLWPALWMLGANIGSAGWPACGETDIMELVGQNPKQVVGSIHWKQSNGSTGTYNNNYNAPQDFSQQFHVFSLLWDTNSVKILVDDQTYMTATNANVTTG
ncbi:MAG: family 16 glycosylhydrolase, partial [Bacteroidetes bacterium]|nr:family 16 glycosylhydrolase [Bacteroidota bacterium]